MSYPTHELDASIAVRQQMAAYLSSQANLF